MTAQPPSESDPQPVPGWPGWAWWLDNGWYYARREVDAEKYTLLLGEIRRAEGGARGGRDGRIEG